MKIQIGSRNEADQCCVRLLSLPSCILPGFPGLETCLPSHMCSMQFHCGGNIQNRYGSAMCCDCSYTCTFMTKHPEQQMVLAKEKRQNSVVGGGSFTLLKRCGSSRFSCDVGSEQMWNFLGRKPRQWLATLRPGGLRTFRRFFTSYSAMLLQFKI